MSNLRASQATETWSAPSMQAEWQRTETLYCKKGKCLLSFTSLPAVYRFLAGS
jgi:hypothetical protein